jgi:hypothetical protein
MSFSAGAVESSAKAALNSFEVAVRALLNSFMKPVTKVASFMISTARRQGLGRARNGRKGKKSEVRAL